MKMFDNKKTEVLELKAEMQKIKEDHKTLKEMISNMERYFNKKEWQDNLPFAKFETVTLGSNPYVFSSEGDNYKNLYIVVGTGVPSSFIVTRNYYGNMLTETWGNAGAIMNYPVIDGMELTSDQPATVLLIKTKDYL